VLLDNHRLLRLTSGNSEVPRCSWLGNTERDFNDGNIWYLIVYVVRNIPFNKKRFDNKVELNGMIDACLKTIDLPDEMKEPMWYPIVM